MNLLVKRNSSLSDIDQPLFVAETEFIICKTEPAFYSTYIIQLNLYLQRVNCSCSVILAVLNSIDNDKIKTSKRNLY